jgi:uncharacterized protein (TIGR01777 family)
MIIGITGASGFLGQHAKQHFLNQGQKVISVPREILYHTENLTKLLEDVDVVIHVAGFPITKRWTPKNKRKIYNSRAITSQNIAEAISQAKNPPRLVISTSAIGIYNNIHYHDEDSNDYADNFLGKVCKAWEAPFHHLHSEKTRVVIPRLGVVIGPGGLVKSLYKLFKTGLGGKIGHGEYPMPFIHIKDLLHFYDQAIETSSYSGVYNLVAPAIITNEEFTHAFADALNKKAPFRIPPVILNLMFGKGLMTVINNPIVIPKRLLEAGFRYKKDQIDHAINDSLEEINKNKNKINR